MKPGHEAPTVITHGGRAPCAPNDGGKTHENGVGSEKENNDVMTEMGFANGSGDQTEVNWATGLRIFAIIVFIVIE